MKNILTLLLAILLYHTQTNAQSGTWTWMHGADTAASVGNYGVQGIASPTNEPPARYQAAYWKDLNGNFWIFGGVCTLGLYNDLWKYNISTNIWTWVSGFQDINNTGGNYGTMGVPSVNNCPSGRGFGANCWTDKNNNLWLFGGSGSFGSDIDDIWKYNIGTNEWTWMKGNSTSCNFGIEGVANVNNTPGARQEVKSGWTDKNNNLWMFGGIANDSVSGLGGVCADLWKFNIASNMWTCMKGANSFTSAGNYGTLGIASTTNLPPARASYTKWQDANDNFYIFGGGDIFNLEYNDTWKYDMLSNNWGWIAGSNLVNDNGTKSVYCNKNSNQDVPSARFENQTVSTLGCSNAFWSFGGFTLSTNTFNDLWLYNIANNTWTWAWGGTMFNDVGNYGTKGIATSTNAIPAKGGVSIWSDNLSNLWVFGGFNSFVSGQDLSNDLWKYTPDTTCFSVKLTSGFSLGTPPKNTICLGDSVLFTIPSNNNLKITPMTGIKLNADSTQILFKPTTTTFYTISATADGTTCPGADTIKYTLTVLPIPTANFSISPNPLTLPNTTFTLTNSSSNAIKYEWYYNNLIFSTQTNDTKSFIDTGTYCITLVAYNAAGCADTAIHCAKIQDSIVIPPPPPVVDTWVVMPSIFSPNGDGKNEELLAVYKNIISATLTVVNRFGEVVYKTNDLSKGWNGKQNNQPCELGTYYYYLKYKDGNGKDKSLQGDVNLIR